MCKHGLGLLEALPFGAMTGSIRRLHLQTIFAITLGLVFAVTFGFVPASGQTSGDLFEDPRRVPFGTPLQSSTSPMTLGVSLYLYPEGDDVIELDGLSGISSGYRFSLARAIGDQFKVSRTSSEIYDGPMDDWRGSFNYLGDEEEMMTIETRKRLVEKSSTNEHDWVLETSTGKLAEAIRLYGFSTVELTVCHSGTDFTDRSSIQPTVDADGCLNYVPEGQAIPSSVDVNLTEHASPSSFWQLMAKIAAVVAVVTLISSLLTVMLRRRSLSSLGTKNLVWIAILTGAGIVSAGAAFIYFATIDRPIADIVLGNDLDFAGLLLATALPGGLFAIPFVVSAILLTRVAPSGAVEPSVSSSSVFPQWLVDASPETTAVFNDTPVKPEYSEEAGPDIREAPNKDHEDDNSPPPSWSPPSCCLLYTSDAADE